MRADRPSSTATLIAAATVLLARDPKLGHRVPAGAAEICARCLTRPWLMATQMRWLVWAAERATIPGLMLHFILRKRWIEDAVRGALARGCRQVVVLGAGFDTLAARLAPQFPAVRFIEIDHPATQAVKRRVEEDVKGGSTISEAMHRHPIFSPMLLRMITMGESAGNLDKALDTVAEYYNDIIPRTIKKVFTVMEPRRDGRLAFHNATWVERALLALWKEPFKSAVSRDVLPRTLGEWGLRLREVADLAAAHPELVLARGEIVVHARRTA